MGGKVWQQVSSKSTHWDEEKGKWNCAKFNQWFEKLLKRIPDSIKPKDPAILVHYLNAYEGTFGFMLREKNPTNLKDSQGITRKMELNVSYFRKISLLDSSRTWTSKNEPKLKGSLATQQAPDPIAALSAQIAELMKSKTIMKQEMENLRKDNERTQNQERPRFPYPPREGSFNFQLEPK